MLGVRLSIAKSLGSLCSKQAPMRRLETKAASSSLTQIHVNKQRIATLNMNNPPVNILNLEMLQSLNTALKEIENNKCRGLILTSTSNTVFCGGLDIKEMYKPDVERLNAVWTAFQDVWLALYGSKMPTAALINGHSPAGGCVFATCCEFRVMLPNFTIGLNETQFGLVAPKFVRASFSNILPKRIAEMALIQGKMFSSEDALLVGLVDDLASSKEEAREKCKKFLDKFTKVDPVARSFTKLMFREEDLNYLYSERKTDLHDFVTFILQDYTQERLGVYLNKLQQKRKNK